MLAVSGALCYVAWQVGTLLGVAGAQVVSLEDFATAVFPVLFVGLAAITARDEDAVVRAVAAAALVVVVSMLVPTFRPFLPIVAAILVAIPGGRSR